MIRRLKLMIALCIMIISGLLGSLFAAENPQPITLNLLGLALPTLGVGLWLLITLLAGALIGLVLGYFSQFRNRCSIVDQKQVKSLEQELKRVRAQALKG